ncbi:hypothetical protein B7463_g217, partial [Scytalidium lignicola]
MSTTIDPRAQAGFANAAAYDAHRPSYPSEAVSSLLSHLNIAGKSGAHIVEVGKFTELLAAREERYEIIAVEPQADMRAQLKAKNLRGVTIIEGNAAGMNVEEGWADACVAAQARFATSSTIENLDTEKRENVKKQVLEVLSGGDVERNEKGELVLHGSTYHAWTSRI